MRGAFRIRFQGLITALLLTALTVGPGCALWKSDEPTASTSQSPLKPVTPHIDAIELEVVYVERPIGDPLMGEALWSELDTISTLNPAVLTSLRRNGIRFGIASSDPPRNLTAVIGVEGGRYSGRRYSQRSGDAMTIDAWPVYPSCEVTINDGGSPRSKTYDQARCVFRVTPERLQDGWVRIEFVPEIHHGDMEMRRVPGDQDSQLKWQLTPSQLVDPLFGQRFVVDLNLGEMVVLSASGDDPKSVGHHFFRGGTTDNKLQRLLIVRLADMKRLDPVYQ